MALFTHLPDKIFEPFASKNRHLYELSLLTVFAAFYSTTRDAPTRDEVIATIFEIMHSKPEMWQSEDDDEVTETDVKKLQGTRARSICDRLTDCGWFEANKSGYRVILEFSPVALHLMQSLWKINNGSVERLEGVMQTLRSILNNLKSGIALTAALTQCASHLADIRLSMRGTRTKMMRIRSEVFKIRGQNERFHFLMNWYVGGVFIQDIEHIMSDRHPWKLRRQTMGVIEEFLNDDSKMMTIGMEYALDHFQKTMTEGTAAEKLEGQEKGRQMAYSGFYAIKEELNAIDEIAKSITALQSKLNELLAVQGTARLAHSSTNTEKLETVMGKFAGFIGKNQSDSADETLPAIVAEKTLHLSEAALRTPNIRRKPKATALPDEPVDPVTLFRQELNAAYQERIHASDDRVLAFIDRMLGNQHAFSFDENSLSTIDDFIAASAVVKMAISGEVSPNVEAHYDITCDDEFDLVVTEYMACPKVTIKKIQENRHAA